MNFPESVHPFEVWRRTQTFWHDLLSDLDLRFPETRKRIALQLSLEIEDEDRNLFENLLEALEDTHQHISPFDWPMLFEWNERWLQTKMLIDIQSALKNTGKARAKETNILRTRLKEIQNLMTTQIVSVDPSIPELLRYRWRFSPLRDEAHYLLTRLEVLSTAKA